MVDQLGIDIGSIALKLIWIQADQNIHTRYIRHNGNIRQVLVENLESFIPEITGQQFRLSFTGNGSERMAQEMNCPHVNEVLAIVEAAQARQPQCRSIIEMGGEDAKLIFLSSRSGRNTIHDFYTNGLCAAGTGSFLDQQAHRLGIDIETFSQLAQQSTHPARIAGRCSVFAKSDMIHSQQIGTTTEDILYGLCLAVAQNFKSTIGKGKTPDLPALFIGGVANNPAMQKAFWEVYQVTNDQISIPPMAAFFPALGALYYSAQGSSEGAPMTRENLLNQLRDWKSSSNEHTEQQQPLNQSRYYQTRPKNPISGPSTPLPLDNDTFFRLDDHTPWQNENPNDSVPVFLGIDIGSVSTNLILLDENAKLLTKRYLMTAGQPLEAVRLGMKSLLEECGSQVEVKGVGVTGSGRYLIADFVGGDIIRNEITAQGKAAVMANPDVDTVFEIGGQDSKYISLRNGRVIDFEMNKVCAAGTGSFLEEQAHELNVSIKDEFARIAFEAEQPARLGERCTVFIESDLKRHFHQGYDRANLIAGLAYSIAYNYLNKVVVHRKIGNTILFQGGVANNLAVCAAFELILGKPVQVPDHNNVTGAIGIAALALENWRQTAFKTRFEGFDLSRHKTHSQTFNCRECENLCEIHQVSISGRAPLYYGSRCEKYNIDKQKLKNTQLPINLLEQRWKRLTDSLSKQDVNEKGLTIGIPMGLFFWEYLPFWQTFFNALNFRIVTSRKTSPVTIRRGLSLFTTESCYPVKVAMGHISELAQQPIDALFIPNFINTPIKYAGTTHTHACPMVQSFPDIIRPILKQTNCSIPVWQPNIQMKYGDSHIVGELLQIPELAVQGKKRLYQALQKAEDAQQLFQSDLLETGRTYLREMEQQNRKVLVLIGRSYNVGDSGLNLDLAAKLQKMGVSVISMDYLPLQDVPIGQDYPNMFWHYGQKILAAIKYIAGDPNLYGVYVTNFGCGPDSYILQYGEREFGHKPFLTLEIDEHSADAGLITRCEAFLDSLENIPAEHKRHEYHVRKPYFRKHDLAQRILYIPHMGDQAHTIAAAFRAYQIDARVFPPSDEKTLELGRKYSTGKECYPYLVTLGDIIKIIHQENGNHDRLAFFMPSATGPCRFGQYHFMQNLVLNEMGYQNVYFINPNQGKDFYRELRISNRGFELLAWNSIILSEMLGKLLRETRPYERQAGKTDQVYQDWLEKICHHIEQKRNPRELADSLIREFQAIPVEKKGSRPVVGLVGEIFVRNHEFSNEQIARQLEVAGLEVWLPTISEWVYYTNHTRKYHTRLKKDWKTLFGTIITDFIQHRIERRYELDFHHHLRNNKEPIIPQLLDYSEAYLSRQYESEACLTIAKAFDYHQKGATGIVNTMPFGCMPGNIVSALSDTVRTHLNDLPWLNIAFDGNGSINLNTRIQAFVAQVKAFDPNQRSPK